MSDFLDAWNQIGDAWVGWMLGRSVVSAVTLAIVGVTILALRGRVSAHVPSRLLLLPLIVLVVPLERALPTFWPEPLPAVVTMPRFADGAGSIEVVRAPSSATEHMANTAAVDGSESTPLPTTPASISAPSRENLGVAALAFAAWILAVLLGVSRLALRQLRTDRLLRRSSRPAGALVTRLFGRLCRSRGIDDPIELRASSRLVSPVATGISRPVVYLPIDLVDRLSPAQLRFVLLHEMEHIRRRDVPLEALVRAIRLGWFFHPGVWIASAGLARWREYACDEAALAGTGTAARTPVAEALFTLINLANDAPRPSGAIAHLLSTRAFMKNRLTRILDRSFAPRRNLTPRSAIALALVSITALTAARSQQVGAAGTAPIVEVTTPSATTDPAANDDVAVVLDQATTWLLRTQQKDGRWAIGDDPKGKNQRDHNEVHVTALAVRALLPGLKHDRKMIARAVDRATRFIEQSQLENGCFGPADPFTMMYGHGQALRALCAVQEHWPDDARRARIEKGVHFAEWARNPYAGWRYDPRGGDNDSKITSMMLLGLRAAADLGIEVDEKALLQGRAYLDQLTLEATGRTGFVSRGQTMSRFTSKKDDFPGELSEEPTAMALLVKLANGESAESDTLSRSLDLLVQLPPEWSPERGSIDYAYWTFGAHVLAQVGDSQADLWRQRLHAALIPNRIVDDGAAHWPAIDAWSHPGMEAYATASAMLALQALR